MSINDLDKLIEQLLQEKFITLDRPKPEGSDVLRQKDVPGDYLSNYPNSSKTRSLKKNEKNVLRTLFVPAPDGERKKWQYSHDKFFDIATGGEYSNTVSDKLPSNEAIDEVIFNLLLWSINNKKAQPKFYRNLTRMKDETPLTHDRWTYEDFENVVQRRKGNIPFIDITRPHSGFYYAKDIENIRAAARISGHNEIFDINDIVAILDDSKHELHPWLVNFLDKLSVEAERGTVDKEFKNLSATLRDYVKRVDLKDRDLSMGKAIPNMPVQSRYKTKYGETTPITLQRIFNIAIADTGTYGNTMLGRLKSIRDFTTKMIENNLSGYSIEQIMSKTIAIDYVRRIVQDYESSAGGFLFENFLAFVAAGTKEGGNTRIEDFTGNITTGSETMGSAKLYRAGATKFGGSAKLFFIAAERGKKQIQYVLAEKGQSLEKIKIYASDKTTVKLDWQDEDKNILLATCGESFKITKLFTKGTEGSVKYEIRDSGDKVVSDVEFTWNKTGGNAELNLLTSRVKQEEYNQVVERAMNSTKEKLGSLFKSINNFNVLTTKYFSILQKDEPSEKQQAFDSAMEEMVELRQNAFTTFSATKHGAYNPFSDFGKVLKPGEKRSFPAVGRVKAATKGELSESTDQLDELILEILQESLDK